jgi:hypothetical protein
LILNWWRRKGGVERGGGVRNWRGSKLVMRGDEGRGLTNSKERGYIMGRWRSEGEDREI